MNTILTIGCMSSHGGVIITGDPLMTVCGKPVARIGDLHSCPLTYPGFVPHSVTPIIKTGGTPRATTNGREVAVANDITGCGASLIPCAACTEALQS